MNDFYRHKKSDKIKWVFTGIAFVLVFVMLIGLCLQLFGAGKVKPSEWFKKSDTEQTQPAPDTEENEKETAAYAVSNHTVKAMSASVSESSDISYPYSPIFNGEHIYTPYYTDGVFTSFKEIASLRPNTGTAALFDYGGNQRGVNPDRIGFEGNRKLDYTGTPEILGKIVIYKDGVYGDLDLSGGSMRVVRDITCHFTSSEITWTEYADCFVSSQVSSMSIVDFSNTVLLDITSSSLNFTGFNTPTKEGHTFKGWYYDPAFEYRYMNEPLLSGIKLYARFDINRYTITLDSNGGSPVENQVVDWHSILTLPTPTRDKYAFKGWFLPNGTRYENYPVPADVTLTAHWERNVFTVTFNTDGGNSLESQDVILNNTVTLPTPEKTGYTFKGWFMSDGTEYADQPITEDITLTAQWEIQTFTITFYVDGEVWDTKIVEYGSILVEVAEPLNLKVLSVRSASGAPVYDDNGAVIVSEDCTVEAREMTNTDKVINTVKNNKWAIIGGVAGGVALIAVLGAIIGGTKRRKR